MGLSDAVTENLFAIIIKIKNAKKRHEKDS